MWTPGHRGVIGQSIVDKLAKKASKSRGPTLLDESTKSHVKQTLHEELIRRWRERCREKEIPTTSGIYQASKVLHPNPIPDQIMKQTPLELSGRLNQTLTGHGYHGEYYHRFNIPDNPTNCFCSGTPILQSRDHIIRDCPMYDEGRPTLLIQFPRLQNPPTSFGGSRKAARSPNRASHGKRYPQTHTTPDHPRSSKKLTSFRTKSDAHHRPQLLYTRIRILSPFLPPSSLRSDPSIGCNYLCGR